MELFKASRQWATRPDDERFATLDELIAATHHYADTAREATVPFKDLAVQRSNPGSEDTDLVLVGPSGQPANFTHWSFGQLAARVGAPADYLRKLPPALVRDNLNYGLEKAEDSTAKLLIHSNGSLLVRAFTSERYSRIWNYEVAERLVPAVQNGWTVPPAITDGAKPSGLYASDHDCFIFLVNEDHRISEPGNPDGLARGIFVENSEVGASSLRVTGFLYRYTCGNHIVWGASKVLEVAVRHVGDILGKSSGFFAAVQQYADSSASDDEAQIAHAYTFRIGDTKEQVLDKIFSKGILSRKQTEKAYDVAATVENLDPRTAWGLAQGITRMSQDIPFADRRTELDRAAGKVLQMAF